MCKQLSPRVARSRRAARFEGAVVGRRAQRPGVAMVRDRASSPCHAPVAKRKGTGLRIRSSGGSIPPGGSMGRHVPRPGDGVLQALCGRFDSDSFHISIPGRLSGKTADCYSENHVFDSLLGSQHIVRRGSTASGEIWYPHLFQMQARASVCRFESDLADQSRDRGAISVDAPARGAGANKTAYEFESRRSHQPGFAQW